MRTEGEKDCVGRPGMENGKERPHWRERGTKGGGDTYVRMSADLEERISRQVELPTDRTHVALVTSLHVTRQSHAQHTTPIYNTNF